jgi:hypothetical protein
MGKKNRGFLIGQQCLSVTKAKYVFLGKVVDIIAKIEVSTDKIVFRDSIPPSN